MQKSAIIAILIFFFLLLVYIVVQLVLRRFILKSAVKTKPNGAETPNDAGMEYEDITIHSGRRELRAWWVRASPANDLHKALLIFHGNYESISEWIPAQKILWQNGISSFVFDYSGFGNSSGKATFNAFRKDAVEAWTIFQSKAGSSVDKYLLAISLGTGILLDSYTYLGDDMAGVILIGTFSSIRGVAVLRKGIPSALAGLLPDIHNNIKRIRFIRVPLLMVHSTSDELFPPNMAKQVFAAANEPKQLVLVSGLKHNDMLEGKAADYLAPVIEYVKAN